jgi:hypothetical protein
MIVSQRSPEPLGENDAVFDSADRRYWPRSLGSDFASNVINDGFQVKVYAASGKVL